MAEMEKNYQELKNRLSEIYDLDMISSLLGWDQATYMPNGGAEARGRQSALLTRLLDGAFRRPGDRPPAGCAASLRGKPALRLGRGQHHPRGAP